MVGCLGRWGSRDEGSAFFSLPLSKDEPAFLRFMVLRLLAMRMRLVSRVAGTVQGTPKYTQGLSLSSRGSRQGRGNAGSNQRVTVEGLSPPLTETLCL